ncbi:6-phosphofructokinase [Glaciibacter superstes]|uniref:6-phosphofructokinase n=1 Tax=Glaciibacter superstes TaxID=501023 RepID=UPI0003B5AE29|nr:6-phosphofructokinase [Glaciibacter superstes]
MRLAIAQTGAPTAVVNRSLDGFLSASVGNDVVAILGGATGLLNDRVRAITRADVSSSELQRVGSWLGGGRFSVGENDLSAMVDTLVRHRVDGLAIIGGNGTMALLEAISKTASARGMALRCVGIPKTIDNDIVGVDHTPGFASAARYLARTVTDLARDQSAMGNVEPVRIVETMGRSTGWLALAASYARHDPEFAADLVLIPETTFELPHFLARVEDIVEQRGRALVVVSEGVAPELTLQPVHDTNHTRLIQGGISRVLAGEVRENLGFAARGEVIGTLQRSASTAISAVDAEEAKTVGAIAATWLTSGEHTDVMVGIEVADSATAAPETYVASFTPISLGTVAGHVRAVPEMWRESDPQQLSTFYDWLDPLIRTPLSHP